MLRQEAVVPYLLEHGVVSAADVVERGITVADLSRRCCVFRVRSPPDRVWILKQGFDAGARETVANEAAACRWLGARPAPALAPGFLAYDRKRGVLVLEGLDEALSFRDDQLARRRCSRLLARRLGQSLARLHATSPEPSAQGAAGPAACSPPWVLSIHRPELVPARGFSAAALELIRIARASDGLGDRLDTLRAGWRAAAPIHGDVRWDNCLVFAAPGARRVTRLRLIDWELAGLGDPLWDVGSVLSEYLLAWLGSVPTRGEAGNRPSPEAALRPLHAQRPAVRAFLDAYLRGAPGDGAPEDELISATRYAAARIVQAHLEQLQGEPRLTAHAVLALQLAANTLRRPRNTLEALLGPDG